MTESLLYKYWWCHSHNSLVRVLIDTILKIYYKITNGNSYTRGLSLKRRPCPANGRKASLWFIEHRQRLINTKTGTPTNVPAGSFCNCNQPNPSYWSFHLPFTVCKSWACLQSSVPVHYSHNLLHHIDFRNRSDLLCKCSQEPTENRYSISR